MRLVEPTSGRLMIDETDMEAGVSDMAPAYIDGLQDPFSSLNPQLTARQVIINPSRASSPSAGANARRLPRTCSQMSGCAGSTGIETPGGEKTGSVPSRSKQESVVRREAFRTVEIQLRSQYPPAPTCARWQPQGKAPYGRSLPAVNRS